MIPRVLIAVFVVLVLSALIPNDSILLHAQDSLAVQIDTSDSLQLRVPDASALDKYSNDPDFAYNNDAPKNTTSIVSRILGYVFAWLGFILGTPLGNFIMKAIFVGAIIGLIIVILNQITGGELVSIVTRRRSNKGTQINIEKEELDELDLEEMIKTAVINSDYHAATRYTYLLALRNLADRGFIKWSIEKTNLDYEREIGSGPILNPFRKLTLYYSYVEYGDFSIDKYGYEDVKAFYSKLQREVTGE